MRTILISYKDVIFDVHYEYSPAEPRVWNDGNGHGHPGYPAEVYIHKVYHNNDDMYAFIEQEHLEAMAELILRRHE